MTHNPTHSPPGGRADKLPPSTAPHRGVLPELRVMHFVGPDAARFLQGYVTIDTAQLSPTQALAGAFCNLQGRVVANGWLWGQSEAISLVTHHSSTSELASFLTPYLNFSRTKLTTAPDAPVGALGDAIEQLTTPVALSVGRAIDANPTIEPAMDQHRISQAWFSQGLRHREIWLAAQVSGKYLPQMLGMVALGAVDFTKGCYLGQEVVARAEHRGKVKRGLLCASFTSAIAPEPGMRLLDGTAREQGVVVDVSGSSQTPKVGAPKDGAHKGYLAYVGKLSGTEDATHAKTPQGSFHYRIEPTAAVAENAQASGLKIELDLY